MPSGATFHGRVLNVVGRGQKNVHVFALEPDLDWRPRWPVGDPGKRNGFRAGDRTDSFLPLHQQLIGVNASLLGVDEDDLH